MPRRKVKPVDEKEVLASADRIGVAHDILLCHKCGNIRIEDDWFLCKHCGSERTAKQEEFHESPIVPAIQGESPYTFAAFASATNQQQQSINNSALYAALGGAAGLIAAMYLNKNKW